MTLRSILSAALLVAAAGSANAAVVNVEASCAGGMPALMGSSAGCTTDPARTDLGNIEIFETGAATIVGDDDFFSLGLGGSLVIEFDRAFGGAASVIEITNRGSSQQEAAEVFVSADGASFQSIGIATNQGTATGARGNLTTLAVNGAFRFLGFRDVSRTVFPGSTSGDGFDVDAVAVSAVPLPASALLLLASLGGLGAVRRARRV